MKADLNEPLDFLADKSFAIVLSSLTMHYIKDWNPLLKEFNRVLQEGGYLIFSVHHPFMDFTYFNCDNYFALELLEDEWSTDKGKIKVNFYHRPLIQIISPVVHNGFIIEEILEPMPTEKFRDVRPDAYIKLTKRPQFLFVRARKIANIAK
ncbi:MAG: methyltransferase domain-containing protein [Halanaerobium sp.]|nr:methyltransferase domain-containing protein [Halanaerobium sp.]